MDGAPILMSLCHPQEKNCCPLHVAARAGQASQVELLIIYGADPGAVDPQGYTPAHYSRSALPGWWRIEPCFQGFVACVIGFVVAKSFIMSFFSHSEANHPELAEHLTECQYELTDRLAYYVSGRKPDHSSGQHWIIPEMADSLDMSDLAKEARAKLQSLPNHLFEELACDVFDEVRDNQGLGRMC